MAQITRNQSHINGGSSRNKGNNSVIGNNKDILVDTAGSGAAVIGAGGRGEFKSHLVIPYRMDRSFTGCRNLIGSVKRFSERKAHNRVALYGLGGSGKTQIALEYVYQCASKSDCDILGVEGSGVLTFNWDLKAIAQWCAKIPQENTENGSEESMSSVRTWLEGPDSGDWTLVIDNADIMDFKDNSSPNAKPVPHSPKGAVVFTTRPPQGCETTKVGGTGVEEVQELFSRRFGSWDSLEAGTSPSFYRSVSRENDKRAKALLSVQFCDIQREADVTESILGTYFVTFDRLRHRMSPAAIAFFDRQNIPEQFLTRCRLKGIDDSMKSRQPIGNSWGSRWLNAKTRHFTSFIVWSNRLFRPP